MDKNLLINIGIIIAGIICFFIVKICGLIIIFVGVARIIASRKKPVQKYEPMVQEDAPDQEPIIQPQQESFLVAGFDYYQDILRTLLNEENYEYDLSAKEFKEEVFERCYQFETEIYPAELEHEPDNPYDSNAIAVKISGKLIGYVGRSDQQKINALLDEGATFNAEIFGGKYKEPIWDEFDNETIETGSTPYKARLIKE